MSFFSWFRRSSPTKTRPSITEADIRMWNKGGEIDHTTPGDSPTQIGVSGKSMDFAITSHDVTEIVGPSDHLRLFYRKAADRTWTQLHPTPQGVFLHKCFQIEFCLADPATPPRA